MLPGVAHPERIGTLSSHGLKPSPSGHANDKINQDRGLITYPFADSKRSALFCVFDGHGANGENVAEFVMWKIQELLLEKSEKLPNDAQGVFEHAFEEADRQLRNSNVQAAVSGSAGIAVFAHRDTLYTASVGDSRAIIGERNKDGKLIAVHALSEDQKPDNPVEMERIHKAGGYVSPPSMQHGPARVWLRKGEGPGLAMARSLGDHLSKSVGVIAKPEVTKFEMDPEKEFLLLVASDGVWEFIESEQAMAIVTQHGHALDGCAALIDESSRRWREAEGNYRDDITAIVCQFPFFPAPAANETPDNSYKMNSFHVKPQGDGNTTFMQAVGVAASPDAAGEAAVVAEAELSNVDAGEESGSTFEQRRLTLQGGLVETDEQMKRLEELRQLHGDKLGPAGDADAAEATS